MTGLTTSAHDTAPYMARPTDRTIRCFTVKVDGRFYGLPVNSIQTVFEIVAITQVPLAPGEVIGIVNLRGKIATAFSLRRRLCNDPKAEELSNLAVGLDHNGESFAIVVDEVGDVLVLDGDTVIEVPSHLGAESVRFSSVHRLENDILPVLDLNWVLSAEAFTGSRIVDRELSSGSKQ